MNTETTLPTTPILLAESIVRNSAKTSIKIEPEVPRSNIEPTIEELIYPEKAEETRLTTANRNTGKRYLALGISITPVERTDDKKIANITTKPVAKRVIFATYKSIPATGTKKTGKRQIKVARIIPNFLISKFPEPLWGLV